MLFSSSMPLWQSDHVRTVGAAVISARFSWMGCVAREVLATLTITSLATWSKAADTRPKDPQQFQQLVDFLKACEYTDQLLTGHGWLHISWNPNGKPRRYVRIGYYK